MYGKFGVEKHLEKEMKIYPVCVLVLLFITAANAQSSKDSMPTQPEIVEAIAPEYPKLAVSVGAEDRVVVEVKINVKGEVVTTKPISGSQLFIKSSLLAAKKWRFDSVKSQLKRSYRMAFTYRIVDQKEEIGISFLPPNEIEVAVLGPTKITTTSRHRYSISNAQPEVTKSFSPIYPPIAHAARADGKVEVEVIIDDKGKVISANAVGGHPLLKASAIGAAKKWEFALDGSNEERSVKLTFIFNVASKKEDAKTSFTSPYQVKVVVSPPEINFSKSYEAKKN